MYHNLIISVGFNREVDEWYGSMHNYEFNYRIVPSMKHQPLYEINFLVSSDDKLNEKQLSQYDQHFINLIDQNFKWSEFNTIHPELIEAKFKDLLLYQSELKR